MTHELRTRYCIVILSNREICAVDEYGDGGFRSWLWLCLGNEPEASGDVVRALKGNDEMGWDGEKRYCVACVMRWDEKERLEVILNLI
jgi:hypothetical protein